MANPLMIQKSKPVKIVELKKSAGILDDHAVRKTLATREGTITKVPVNPYDIVNKAYVDGLGNVFIKVDGTSTTTATIPFASGITLGPIDEDYFLWRPIGDTNTGMTHLGASSLTMVCGGFEPMSWDGSGTYAPLGLDISADDTKKLLLQNVKPATSGSTAQKAPILQINSNLWATGGSGASRKLTTKHTHERSGNTGRYKIQNFINDTQAKGFFMMTSGLSASNPERMSFVLASYGVEYSTPYDLSIQSNDTFTYIELLNNTGANAGAFFGLNDDTFELWNYQGVGFSSGNYPIIFYGGADAPELLKLDLVGGTVFNETGLDIDFRIESDANANMFFVDAGNSRIGVKKNNPAYEFDVTGEINATTGYRINGTAGASGTFTTTDLKTVTVTNGIITAIV